MPELPEVQTTVTGLNETVSSLVITDAWTDYNSPYFKGSETIKDPAYFKHFKKEIVGKRIRSVERRAKNVLLRLDSGETILIHMKMTGHIIIGRYGFDAKKKKDPWSPAPDEREALRDPFNRFIHFVLTLSKNRRLDGQVHEKQLVLSDMRKFAKVALLKSDIELRKLGPEPLDDDFTLAVFKKRLDARPNGNIKTVLMDQEVISGIGNIYSDEALFRAGIHPETKAGDVEKPALRKLYTAIRDVLKKGIDFGGDSMSDYRNIHGERGRFQGQHQAYRKTGQRCEMTINGKRCAGTIKRKVVNGRSAHFCSAHQRPRA